jgi:hypothetical protein
MGKVLAAFEELGKPILWGMGWVNRRLGSFGGHPLKNDDGEQQRKIFCLE